MSVSLKDLITFLDFSDSISGIGKVGYMIEHDKCELVIFLLLTI